MCKKITLFFLIILALILSVGIVSASSEIENNISKIQTGKELDLPITDYDLEMNLNEFKSGENIRPSGNTFSDIQKAVDSAKDNDIIQLNGTYIGSGEEIKITKPLTISGTNNAVLDAKNTSRIFFIKTSSFTIKDVKFINGNSKNTDSNKSDIEAGFQNGGAIFMSGKKLTVSNCVFENNYCANYGSAIYHENVKYTQEDIGMYDMKEYAIDSSVSNCRFTNNKVDSTFQNGVIYFSSKGIAKINNCNFINNIGGIHSTNCTVSNSKFSNNKGMVIEIGYISKSQSKKYNVIIKKCTFENNNPLKENGIISNDGVCTIVDCIFKNNSNENTPSIISYGILTLKKSSSTRKYSDGNYFYKSHVFDDSLKAYQTVVIKASKIVAGYKTGKLFKVTIYNGFTKKQYTKDNFNDIKDLLIEIKVFTGKKYKTFTHSLNSKGIAKFNTKSIGAGNHNVKVTLLIDGMEPLRLKSVTSTIKIKKAATIVKAPKITAKKSKSKIFKITVKKKATKKAISGVKVKIKLFTGKKYKSYTLKTNKRGIVKINTKKLSKGLHKVTVKSANKNYIISARSSIKII